MEIGRILCSVGAEGLQGIYQVTEIRHGLESVYEGLSVYSGGRALGSLEYARYVGSRRHRFGQQEMGKSWNARFYEYDEEMYCLLSDWGRCLVVNLYN